MSQAAAATVRESDRFGVGKRRRGNKAPLLRRRPSRYLSEGDWRRVGAALRLSERQLEIARLVFDGLKEPRIGRKLGLSTSTVHTYLDRIFKKLDIHTRSDLITRVFVAYLHSQRRYGGG